MLQDFQVQIMSFESEGRYSQTGNRVATCRLKIPHKWVYSHRKKSQFQLQKKSYLSLRIRIRLSTKFNRSAKLSLDSKVDTYRRFFARFDNNIFMTFWSIDFCNLDCDIFIANMFSLYSFFPGKRVGSFFKKNLFPF